MSGAFWDWAVGVYAVPEVSGLCLALQDEAEQSVPLMLWGAWLGEGGVRVTPDQAEEAAAIAHGYHEHVIAPLRTLRRRLKNPLSDVEDTHRLSLREGIKTLELQSEAALMSALAGVAVKREGAGSIEAALGNMASLSRAWGPVVPRPRLTALAEAIGRIRAKDEG